MLYSSPNRKKIILAVSSFLTLGLVGLLAFSLSNQAAEPTDADSSQEVAESASDQGAEGQAFALADDPEANLESTASAANLAPADPVEYEPARANPISGLVCSDPDRQNRRPLAVMISADVAARPAYGLSLADLVYEMPVVTNQITRLMAVFVCNSPKEIGSIRSARHDYLTLAKGLDAMLAHWGGSHFALEMLKNTDTVPDLDALQNPGGAFYRKSGRSAPHNGFSSYDGLYAAAKDRGYNLEDRFDSHKFRSESQPGQRGAKGGELTIGYPGSFRVHYQYDAATNRYLRSWGGQEDIDGLNNQRIAPKNIVVLISKSRQIEGQYNDVDIEGEGEMHAYMEGREFFGSWIKEKGDCVIGDELVCVNSKPMRFFKDNGQELEFVPGQIWINVIEPGQTLKWQPED